jgi:polar amino acid transport system permease protein
MTARTHAMVPYGRPLPVLLPMRRRPPRSLTLPLDGAWQRHATLAVLVLLALWLLCAEALAQAGLARPGIVALLWKWTPVIFRGFLFNVLISVLSMAIGTIAGVALGLLQVSLIRPVQQAAWVVTQFFRNAPWLVILFYCILLIPFELDVFGLTVPFPAWIKAVIGLSLPVMAYVSEFVRGAVRSIPSGQWEASESLAFSRFQTMTMVILPQCLKRLLPPWMNLYAILTMATPLVSIVGVQEAMTLTRAALSSEGRFDLLIPMYLYILVWFFLYCYPISQLTMRLERRHGRAS